MGDREQLFKAAEDSLQAALTQKVMSQLAHAAAVNVLQEEKNGRQLATPEDVMRAIGSAPPLPEMHNQGYAVLPGAAPDSALQAKVLADVEKAISDLQKARFLSAVGSSAVMQILEHEKAGEELGAAPAVTSRDIGVTSRSIGDADDKVTSRGFDGGYNGYPGNYPQQQYYPPPQGYQPYSQPPPYGYNPPQQYGGPPLQYGYPAQGVPQYTAPYMPQPQPQPQPQPPQQQPAQQPAQQSHSHQHGQWSAFAQRMGNNVVNGMSSGFGWTLGGNMANDVSNWFRRR